ncbi:hypothetical protein LWI29_024325 [Acer saccharum]|uniref:Uncharacterized protein n=1 Tax=Acer saccharum TaxID=4024 RepID=A0AA39SBN2_ACESA|nr:hypothetical protein LWI29_024325 [Acer saccharum]
MASTTASPCGPRPGLFSPAHSRFVGPYLERPNSEFESDQRTSQFWLERWTSGAATSASPAAPYWAIGAGGRRWSTPAHDQRRATGRFAPVSGAGGPVLVDQRTVPKITGRPAPLTGVNHPVARRWSCAGVDQRRPPAPIAQYGAAGLALVAAPDVQRSSQNWLVRWSYAGPPAQVHQRTE